MRGLWFAVAIIGAAACSQQPAPDTGHAQAPAAGRTARVGVMAIAPTLAGGSAASMPEAYEPPPPTATYPSLEAVCVDVTKLMRSMPSDSTVRRDTVFEYQSGGSARGCGVHLWSHRGDGGLSVDSLIAQLRRRGWSEPPGWKYQADGPDGTMYGLVSKEALCVLGGSWDGGDDSDTTYVPSDAYELMVTCVPRKLNDGPK